MHHQSPHHQLYRTLRACKDAFAFISIYHSYLDQLHMNFENIQKYFTDYMLPQQVKCRNSEIRANVYGEVCVYACASRTQQAHMTLIQANSFVQWYGA